MFDTVILNQLFGMTLGFLLVIGWISCFQKWVANHWPFLFLAFIFPCSAVLTIQAIYPLPAIRFGVFLLSALLSLFGIFRLVLELFYSFEAKLQQCAQRNKGLVEPAGFAILVLLFIVELLFAAFPGYRYDQWYYHLTVPKLIDKYGTLPPLFSTDHTHFSGSWEYFFTWLRIFLKNDWAVQTTTTTISFLCYVLPSAGFLSLIAAQHSGANKHEFFKLHWTMTFALLCVYAHFEHEPLVSAKPDFVLLSSALGIIAAQQLKVSQLLFWSLFLALAGASFKVTWLHSALALALGVGVVLASQKRQEICEQCKSRKAFFKNLLLPALSGGSLGLLTLIPYLLKNYLIFENPLHPTQAFGFVSKIATPEFLNYWKHIAGRPNSFIEILHNALGVLKSATYLFLPLSLSLAVVVWQFVRQNRVALTKHMITPKQITLHQKIIKIIFKPVFPWLTAWLAYLAIWSFLLQANTFPRFVATIAVFPLALIACSARVLNNRFAQLLVVLLPCFLAGSIEVKLKKMWHAARMDMMQFNATNFGPELQDFRESVLIDSDAAMRRINTNCKILATKRGSYAFNMPILDESDYIIPYFLEKFGKENAFQCPFAFLTSLDICYLIEHKESHLYTMLFGKLKELPLVRLGEKDKFRDLEVYWVGSALKKAAEREQKHLPHCKTLPQSP